jgi:hypothetical protein
LVLDVERGDAAAAASRTRHSRERQRQRVSENRGQPHQTAGDLNQQ